ncbi:MAG: DNA primase [Planctomycetes bacterium]|nr:DNA primase [Planctomycetota bacterium]
MPGFLGEDQVRQVKDRVDLVQLMGEYTPLRKSGAQFTGCCAFHQERTPSMYVYPEQQTYHCFGCGAHGDAISLIREKERLEFVDAIELLAKRVGIVLKYDKQTDSNRSERDALVALYEFATAFYERVLWDALEAREARDYLASRKLGAEVCKRFRLGWAPGSGQLVGEARRKGFASELLLKADLAVDREGRIGDRFYQRVTFPICDRFGNPIAFSARLLPAAELAAKEAGRGVGKYVNSTDTPLYHKGGTVFNLHRARTASRERGRIVVMEGPTDVMAADQAGYGECVAVLGTALTPDHTKQLGNLVGAEGRVVLLLDGDRAGQANSLKAIRTCLSVGVPVRVAVLPDELDPAELLVEGGRADGREIFERVIAEGRADLDHLLRSLAPRPYELDHRRRLAVADDILAALRPMPDAALRSLHMRDVADYFALERSVLEARLSGARPPAAASAESSAAPGGPAPAPELDEDRDAILHALARHQDLRAFAADDLQLEPSHFPEAWQAIAAALLEEGTDVTSLLAMPEVDKDPVVRASVFRWVNSDLASRRISMGDARASLIQNAARLRLAHIKSQLLRLSREIADLSRSGDMSRMAALSGERFAYERQLSDLRGLSDAGPQ